MVVADTANIHLKMLMWNPCTFVLMEATLRKVKLSGMSGGMIKWV